MAIKFAKQYPYTYVPETKADLDWAELVTLDLSKYDEEASRKELAQELLDAVNTKGFFYLKNFGLSREEVDRQFGIGSEFYTTPLEERLKSKSDLEHGNSNGYSPAGKRDMGHGIMDRKEEYNVPIQEDSRLHHPAVIEEALPEIRYFQHHLHDEVLRKLYDLIAIGLQVPPESLNEIHQYKGGATGILRYMRYSPYTEEELKKINLTLYGGGHTDSCAITLLFRQTVAALQIKDPQSGEWKWVKPMNDCLTVNAGDVLSILTGGYIRSTIHRVAVPPPDQRMRERLGVIYFSRPPKHLHLNTIKSPVLKEMGLDKNGFEEEGNEVPTAGEFQVHKELWQQSKSKDKNGAVILPGFVGRRYN